MSHSRHLTLTDLAATMALGDRLAAVLVAGDVVCLAGDLGAGKTTLARQVIARMCGIDDAPSPTYTIVQVYETDAAVALWHVDLYRIEAPGELEQLGLDDAFDDAITLIEWPERLEDDLPADRLEISIAITGAGVDTVREARITGFGSWESRVDEF
ncbi:tRNA (adenosine(37)-N6)-threonylcarbamoyltransferase complex ATPase subunit type 1 TsaE [Maricaulis salignorans]|uniref:tRNA threonylcarbamoyladenosine biosynthesis protein TsaE n=1 Tax=Maricaulis salignorans TaxID=144026 RepID=A0A1G9ST79_9PROT|nr:tRNA (adenosine(37)-N6)-threonylcarbamoyltransferase complex ATPase subunit type 1 TsaE [Maricaulis salignorans]SDM38658.1 tRNA threonylcarbamoyladenosine biosynthesis protein TsaE [Maricaulis salignorans]